MWILMREEMTLEEAVTSDLWRTTLSCTASVLSRLKSPHENFFLSGNATQAITVQNISRNFIPNPFCAPFCLKPAGDRRRHIRWHMPARGYLAWLHKRRVINRLWFQAGVAEWVISFRPRHQLMVAMKRRQFFFLFPPSRFSVLVLVMRCYNILL